MAMAMSTEKDRFLAVYEEEHQRTMRVIQAFPEEKADFRPHPRCKTARELAWIFVLGRGLGTMVYHDEFASRAPGGAPPPAPSSWFELLSALEKAHKDFGDLIRSSCEEKLRQKVKFFTAPMTMGDIPRMDLLWF